MMRRTWIAVALVALLLTTGCLGSVSPAEVPAQDAQEQDWEKTEETSESIAMGVGERVSKEYHPTTNANQAGVRVVSANDVPVLDESEFIPQALDRVEEERDIQLEPNGTQTVELVNEQGSVEADVYDIQQAPAEGKALVFIAPCEPFVVVIGYGVTQDGGGDDGGLLGSGSTATDGPADYQSAVEVARHVTC